MERYARRVSIVRWLQSHADAALAVALAGSFVAESVIGVGATADLTDPPLTGPAIVVGTALALSLAWRRSMPLVPLGLALLGLSLAGGASPDASVALILMIVIAAYSVGGWATGHWRLLGALGVGALAGLVAFIDAQDGLELGDLTLALLLVAGPWLAGVGIRHLRERATRLEEMARAKDKLRREQVEAAVLEERGLIARELHDVVAHAITIIVLQARGARRSLPSGADVADEALGVIEETGGQALGEMRRLVAILRSADGPAPLRPQPGLRDLPDLLGQFRDSRLDVELVVEGEPARLAPGLDLSAYRVVQQSLTNTLHHSGQTTATVRLRQGADELHIEIEDDGRVGHATSRQTEDYGMGLMGMRERVEFYGGTFQAGPRPTGGFRVSVRFPLGAGPT